MFYYIYHSRCIPLLCGWGPCWREFTPPDCSLQYTLIILDWELGQRQGKGGGFGNTLIIVQGASSYALLLAVFRTLKAI